MHRFLRFVVAISLGLTVAGAGNALNAQELPLRYATLELFTNTPCPICGSQNPGFFSRLEGYKGFYHLISFYPGRPYTSCIFYQANIPENTARLNFYPQVFGTPTVAINGVQFKSSGSVSTAILDAVTGGESWLSVEVSETAGNTRSVDITLRDHVGGSIDTAQLFAVIAERLILYNAPNGETMHHNVFRKFLTNVNGEDVDMSSGTATKSYQYTLDPGWQVDETYVIAWLMDPETKEIYNSGTRFDPPVTTATTDVKTKITPLNIYPNPATEEVNIDLPETVLDIPVRVYDINGALIFEENLSGKSVANINTCDWASGCYEAVILTSDRRYSGQIQIVK